LHLFWFQNVQTLQKNAKITSLNVPDTGEMTGSSGVSPEIPQTNKDGFADSDILQK